MFKGTGSMERGQVASVMLRRSRGKARSHPFVVAGPGLLDLWDQ